MFVIVVSMLLAVGSFLRPVKVPTATFCKSVLLEDKPNLD